MKYKDILYMFAIMPPPELYHRIDSIRKEFHERFRFSKALKPPVHITLFPPFQIPIPLSEQFESAVARMQGWADTRHSFQITLHNYNFFDNPEHPVVFIDVVKSPELIDFHSGFIREWAKYGVPIDKKSYSPHFTIGYRDVTPEAFPAIKAYYEGQSFDGSFTCNRFHLWKHNGASWQVSQTYGLGGEME